MASDSRQPWNNRFLHVKDIHIDFIGRRPTSSIVLRLHVDDTHYDSQPYQKTKSIRWNCGIYISQHSRIVLSVFRAKNKIPNPFVDTSVAEIALKAGDPRIEENSIHSCSDPQKRIRARITLAESIDRRTFIELLGTDVESALAAKYILLDRMKNLSSFVKAVLSIGSALSELNDIAKVVFELSNKLFKILQEQQEFHHMAVDLAELLSVKFRLSDIIPEKLRQGSVQKSLKTMMDVIEEALVFIKDHINSHSLSILISRREELIDLKAKLFAASENLSLCLTANVFVMVSGIQNNIDGALLKDKLNPVLPARTSIDHHCLEGTRVVPLEQVMDWAKALHVSANLYHVHAVAGSGKSSMASTVCEKLEMEKTLAGAFFCKRDVPDQRDPSRILPSLSYTLALRHEAYKECLMRSLEDEPDITSRSVEQQVKTLFRRPLAELSRNDAQAKPFVYVVDALDECGDDVSRQRLVDSLFQIASLTDWLKIFITSRPTNELMRKLSSANTQLISINLNDTDAESDIKLYTQASLKALVDDSGLSASWLTEDTVQKLSTLASGLFIWTSTMIKFVRGQLDMDNAMRLVLSGHVAEAETSLDDLYIKVIEGGGSGDNNLMLEKAVLGIVSITAKNRPLSMDGMHDFLQSTGRKVSKGTLVTVINHLRSVLYEDASKGNAIRVCHPSFLDFLEDHERSGIYWTNVELLHAAMAEASLNLMKTQLRFNICGLESSHVSNGDISDLSQKIESNIPESLIYSCLYWATHFTEVNRTIVEDLVAKFFQCLNVIYWVEILSLIDGIRTGLDALQNVMAFFKDNAALCSLAADIHRLISSSYDAICHSTPHLYISALVWLPQESPLRPLLSCITSDALIEVGRNKCWSSMLWMYTLGMRIWQVAFSRDNQTIAACSQDGNITIFDVKKGVPEMRLRDNESRVVSIAFSPNGRSLASGSADRSVIIWNLHTGKPEGDPLTGHLDSVTSIVFSPDGSFMASLSWDGEIRIWDAQSRAVVLIFDGCRGYGRLAYSHDGAKLACCGVEGIKIRDAQTGKLLDALLDIDHIFDIAYSQDDKFLVSGSKDHIVGVWNAETLAGVAELKGHTGYIYSVFFSRDHNTLFSVSFDGKIIRWDMSSLQMTGVYVQESAMWSATCSSDDRLLASSSSDGSVRVWSIDSLFHDNTLLSVNDRVWCASCSPDGDEIVSAVTSGQMRVHSLKSGELLRTLNGHTSEVNSITYSPNGKLLASGSSDCTVRLWNAATGVELLKLEGHKQWISAIVFLPNGSEIISSSVDGTVRRWNIDDNVAEGVIFFEHNIALRSMCISTDGNLLGIGMHDGGVYLGDLSSGKVEECQVVGNAAIRAIAFSPDCEYLASGSEDNVVQLWCLTSHTETRRFEGHGSYVLCVSFSQDGRQLLSSSGDGTIRQWCVSTGAQLRQLIGHTNSVMRAIYSIDEKHIISCSDDGTIRIWSAKIEENNYVSEVDEYLPSLELESKDGWIKSNTGDLILWIPSEYRSGFRDMCEKCIPSDAPNHPVRLDWTKFLGGENWTNVLITDGESA